MQEELVDRIASPAAALKTCGDLRHYKHWEVGSWGVWEVSNLVRSLGVSDQEFRSRAVDGQSFLRLKEEDLYNDFALTSSLLRYRVLYHIEVLQRMDDWDSSFGDAFTAAAPKAHAKHTDGKRTKSASTREAREVPSDSSRSDFGPKSDESESCRAETLDMGYPARDDYNSDSCSDSGPIHNFNVGSASIENSISHTAISTVQRQVEQLVDLMQEAMSTADGAMFVNDMEQQMEGLQKAYLPLKQQVQRCGRDATLPRQSLHVLYRALDSAELLLDGLEER